MGTSKNMHGQTLPITQKLNVTHSDVSHLTHAHFRSLSEERHVHKNTSITHTPMQLDIHTDKHTHYYDVFVLVLIFLF